MKSNSIEMNYYKQGMNDVSELTAWLRLCVYDSSSKGMVMPEPTSWRLCSCQFHKYTEHPAPGLKYEKNQMTKDFAHRCWSAIWKAIKMVQIWRITISNTKHKKSMVGRMPQNKTHTIVRSLSWKFSFSNYLLIRKCVSFSCSNPIPD